MKAMRKLVSRKEARGRHESLQIKHAFTMLLLNKQNCNLEQLLTDNENLIDQINRMKTPTGQASQHSVKVTQEEASLLNQQRDQTSEKNKNNSNWAPTMTDHTENNRSDKDLSPGVKPQQAAKGTAFMRAIDESTLHTMIPQIKQDSEQTEKLFGVEQVKIENSGPPFCEGFSEKLTQLVRLCQQSHDISAIPSVQSSLQHFATKFDSEIQKVRIQCTQVQQLKQMLATKVNSYEKLEIETLELHLQLDAKLRALESVLKCGGDPSKLFKFDKTSTSEIGTQTSISINDILKKEANLQMLEKELEIVQLKQSEEFA